MPGAPIEPLDGVDAVLAVGTLGREPMERGRFGLIQTVGTGYDNVDVAAATELGIMVANMPASQTGNAESVAEHVVLLMLALSRQLNAAQEGLRQRRWAQPLGSALLGKRACIVGLGDVGSAVAARLQPFGMELTATRNDPSKPGPPYVAVFAADRLAEAFREADYVVLCARASEANRFLLNAGTIAAMKRGAILINIARGSLVDHEALLQALRSGHLRAAGLDVFWEEPVDPDHPLLQLPNVIATPHIAGVTDVNMARTLRLIAENLRRFARGEYPYFLINQPIRLRSISV